jgi:glycolate oxidase
VGPDLAGLLCGSEGTLAIVTRVWCRLTPKPKAFRTGLAVYNSSRDATNTVAGIIAAGITPAALEMLDGVFIKVVEEAFHLGFPTDAQAMLLIEVDGVDIPLEGGSSLDAEMQEIERIARANNARTFEASADEKKRDQLWLARRKAFGSLGRLNLSHCTQDSCVPRSKLPDVLEEIGRICRKYDLFVTNCFHAGDGNVHPALCFDEADPEQVRRIIAASGEIVAYCVSVGGSVTGEHGVGIEKMAYMKFMYSPEDLALMHSLRHSFSPEDRMNPYKILPREGVEIDLVHPCRNVSL